MTKEKARRYFKDTPFKEGFELDHGIAFGHGWSTSYLRYIFIDTRNKRKAVLEASPFIFQSTYALVWLKDMPKNIAAFDEIIKHQNKNRRP